MQHVAAFVKGVEWRGDCAREVLRIMAAFVPVSCGLYNLA